MSGYDEILGAPSVQKALRDAWSESQPGSRDGHEEGGFILLSEDGAYSVSRWPKGETDRIQVPPHPNGLFKHQAILATLSYSPEHRAREASW